MSRIDEKELLEKYRTGKCDEAELRWLEAWYSEWNVRDRIFLSETELNYAESQMRMGLMRQIDDKRIKIWPKVVAIAASIALILSGIWFFGDLYEQPNRATSYAQDITPGIQAATLTLANGQKILINDRLAGNIVNQSGVTISKTRNGALIYTISGQNTEISENAMNTLETTRGQQTQVRLPDGSTVYLNALSSLTYPANFTRKKLRKVVLRGEAYFKIAHDKSHPFVVESKGQEVEVLGTQFNINAYEDEMSVKTTLAEGIIRVNDLKSLDHTTLKPNQQAVLSNNQFQIKFVNAGEVIAWKDGLFIFDNENIKSVMRKVARWYNVDVEYRGDIENKGIGGMVSQYKNLSQLLEMLKSTKEVDCELRGRTIIVSPYNQ